MEKKKLIRSFIIKALITFVVWNVLYYGVIKPNGVIDEWLTTLVVDGSVWGLNVLGFESMSLDHVIYINGQHSVLVANQCNGLELIALFVGFLICFPGDIKSKILYVFAGSVIIALSNIVREIALSLNYNYFQASFDLNHKYTYTLIVYALVFVIWKHWLNRYSAIASNNLNRNEA